MSILLLYISCHATRQHTLHFSSTFPILALLLLFHHVSLSLVDLTPLLVEVPLEYTLPGQAQSADELSTSVYSFVVDLSETTTPLYQLEVSVSFGRSLGSSDSLAVIVTPQQVARLDLASSDSQAIGDLALPFAFQQTRQHTSAVVQIQIPYPSLGTCLLVQHWVLEDGLC
jgi:hypothetical protein